MLVDHRRKGHGLWGVLLAASLAGRASLSWAGPVEDLVPGHWYEVPGSHMRDVAYVWPDGVTHTINGILVEGVMDLWSGGAFDTRRDRLMVWGGGHAGYGGNEIYAFSVADLRWYRLYDPVAPTRCVPYYSDGSPASSHSYGFLQYLPNVDRLGAFETGAWCEQGIGFANANAFDPQSATWERWPDSIVAGYSQTAYDPVTGHAWVKGSEGECYLASFDPVARRWTIRSDWQGCYPYYVTMEVDPMRRLLVGVGAGAQRAWNIDAPGTITRIDLATTGDQTIVNADAPGLAYDPTSGKLVGWTGGADVFTLDTATWAWARVSPAVANTVTPTAPNPRGTYGRFRYVPSKNVFVVVNHVDENVFIYRLNDAPPIPTPDAGPGAPDGAPGVPDAGSVVNPPDGCACRVRGPGGAPRAGWVLAGFLWLLGRLRRRRLALFRGRGPQVFARRERGAHFAAHLGG